jgi:hypothetical protein
MTWEQNQILRRKKTPFLKQKRNNDSKMVKVAPKMNFFGARDEKKEAFLRK